MTRYLNSDSLISKLTPEITRRSRQLIKDGVHPHLAVVVVGEDDRYPVLKQRHGHKLGVETSIYRLPATCVVQDVIGVILFLAEDPTVHGILIQLPLPASWPDKDVDRILRAIPTNKDVDGLLPLDLKDRPRTFDALIRTAHRDRRYLPTTAWAMLSLCRGHNIDLHGALVVGHGRLVGTPLHQILTHLGIKHVVVDAASPNRETTVAAAKLILAGTDVIKPIFNRRTVQKGVAIVAAGDEIDHDDLKDWASCLTPVKGGIGPLTVSYLFYQTVLAAQSPR